MIICLYNRVNNDSQYVAKIRIQYDLIFSCE